MSESKIETDICDLAARLGWEAYKFSSPNNKGVHDRIFVKEGGKIIFLEIKDEGKTPTKLQLRKIQRFKDLGFISEWVDSVEDAKAVFLNYHNKKSGFGSLVRYK